MCGNDTTSNGRPKRVAVAAPDPTRRRDAVELLRREGVEPIEARCPLEALWRYPDVEAIAIPSTGGIEVVPLRFE